MDEGMEVERVLLRMSDLFLPNVQGWHHYQHLLRLQDNASDLVGNEVRMCCQNDGKEVPRVFLVHRGQGRIKAQAGLPGDHLNDFQ
jgi:hypothetical protein